MQGATQQKILIFFSCSRPWVIYFLSIFLIYPSITSAVESRKVEKMIEDTLPDSEKLHQSQKSNKKFENGKFLYKRFCSHCHGKKGKGDGTTSYYLTPKPRDISRGIFKFHSTQNNSLPLNEDLFNTIYQGIPGTSMPAMGKVLSKENIDSIITYIKSFSPRFDQEIPNFQIKINAELPYDGNSISYGRELYRQLRCGRCHGKEGERSGILEDSLNDTWGETSYVFDLRNPFLYKAGSSSENIYKTLVTGIDGTSMSAYDFLNEDELWHLVHFLQSQHITELSKSFPNDFVTPIISKWTAEPLTVQPNNLIWDNIPKSKIKMLALQAEKKSINFIWIQSIFNQNQIAIRLTWEDLSEDNTIKKGQHFIDSAAIQFALGTQPLIKGPFFGMGHPSKPVNIWHWKAKAKNQELKFSLNKPNNILFVNPFKETSVEELNAEGLGNLVIQPLQSQILNGKANWVNGKWTVVFVRDLLTLDNKDIQFQINIPLLISFAIWDGSREDKNAKKAVSFWHQMILKNDHK